MPSAMNMSQLQSDTVKYCARQDTKGKIAQYAVPARQETVRFVAWLVSVLGGALLLFKLGVPKEITLAALGVLGFYKLVSEWLNRK